MIRTKLAIFFAIAVLFLGTASSQAQTPQLVVVNYVAADEQADSLALSAFFTVTDGNGRPLPQPNIESATIQLLGANNTPLPAIVDDPQTPVYIALLIDGSGSMQNVIGDVRQAARSAIDSAPPTAFFAVIQFNETISILEDFTNDQTRVKSAINVVESVPNRGTCLYDAVYDAIKLLDNQIKSPQERRAIILFTDGKDQLTASSDAPCSRYTYNDVINAARPSGINAPITPIHTIGLFDASGGNLNESELRSMAADTIAYSAIGGQTNLNSLFQQIIDGLNSQFVARANVFAAQGENQAVLAVKVRNIDAPLTTTFNFFSNTNYDLPPPPVSAQINSLQYDAANNVYLLSLSVANPESIYQLIINVWDVRRGTQVTDDQIFENPEPTLVVELSASNFEAGREYNIRVQAVDEDGFLITDEEGETLLTERKIVYEPEQAEAVEFTIQAVNADYENGLLLIDLDVPDVNRVQTYEGFIVDSGTGGKIYDFGPAPFAGKRIQETLPEAIQSAETPGSYRVTIYLTTPEQLRSEAIYEDFNPTPLPKPGLVSRIATGLGNSPIVLISIVVIILSIAGYFVMKKRQEKKMAPPFLRPPVDKTSLYPPNAYPTHPEPAEDDFEDWFEPVSPIPSQESFPATPPMVGIAQPRLRLKVVRAPGSSLGMERFITQFPCIIGREGSDVNITEDRRVSRPHVKISLQGEGVVITDLGSRNGALLGDKKLEAHRPTPLIGAQTLRLSSQTHIELELM